MVLLTASSDRFLNYTVYSRGEYVNYLLSAINLIVTHSRDNIKNYLYLAWL